jgi:glycosyltransferase involved in cell wall biosynthesis
VRVLEAAGGGLPLSVVIPTYDRSESLRRVVDALLRQTLAPHEFEVVVSVDGSCDGTRDMLDRLAAPFALRVLVQPHRGRAAACNAGILASRGEVVLLLDDDMEPAGGLLSAHLRAHAESSRVAVLGAVPIVFGPLSAPVVQYMGLKFGHHLQKLARAGYVMTYRDFYSGNCSVSRALLLEVGLFDEDFQVYGNEDGELARRLLAAGAALVYSGEALAHQHYEKTFATLARDTIAKGRTAVLFAQKFPDAYDKLALSRYGDGLRRWRMVRSVLLGLQRLSGRSPEAAILLMEWLERRRPASLQQCYRFALDYFYWVGVQEARGRR